MDKDAELRRMQEELASLRASLAAQEGHLQAVTQEMDAMLRDVEQQRNELALAHAQASSAAGLLDRIIDTADDLIVFADETGRIRRINQKQARRIGFASEALLGRTLDALIADANLAELARELPPNAIESRGVLFERVSAARQYGAELRLKVGNDAERMTWELSASVVLSPQGKLEGVVAIFTDVTAWREAEAALIEHQASLERTVSERTQALSIAKEMAEAANRAKSTFLANMSHELRTPLSGFIGMITLARRRMVDPKGIEQMGRAMESAQRLLSIINDILDLSKIEAERLSLETENFELGDVLDDVANTVTDSARRKGLQFSILTASGLVRQSLRGDRLRLGQILLNLVGNAVKFTEHGEVAVRASEVEATTDRLLLRFEIEDSGIGIAGEDIGRLFSAFEQADGSMTRRYGGTGLGLAISKRLVQMMDGQIGVSSEPGRGSTFWFTVWLARGESAATQRQSCFEEEQEVVRQLGRFAGTPILLVEDEPVNAEVTRSLLEQVGLRVDVANDGLAGVSKARGCRYGLVLMDMQMPNLNGTEATRVIRDESMNRDTPILALTANAFDEDKRACLEAGMNDHVSKPFTPLALYKAVLAWLPRGPA